MIAKINNHIQRRMQMENLEMIDLPTAARWLDQAGVLKDAPGAPGLPLRRHAQKGNVFGARKHKDYYWYIHRIQNYDPLLTVEDMQSLFDLKSRTSIYRKIRQNHIPFHRHTRKGIYFKASDLLRWAIERNKSDIIEAVRERKKMFVTENVKITG